MKQCTRKYESLCKRKNTGEIYTEKLKDGKRSKTRAKAQQNLQQYYFVPFNFSQQGGNRLPLLKYSSFVKAVGNNSLCLLIVQAYGDGVYLYKIKYSLVESFSLIKRYILLRNICE